MSGLDSRSRLYLLKLETTEGTDPTPVVGTDDLFVTNDTPLMRVGQTMADIRAASPTGGIIQTMVASRAASHELVIPFYGAGLSTGVIQLPKWVDILGTFNDVAIGSADTSDCDITLDLAEPQTTDSSDVVTANDRTFTVYEYLGASGGLDTSGTKLLTKMTGCRVQSLTLRMAVGEPVTLRVSYIGIPSQPTSVTTDLSGYDLDSVTTDFVTPNLLQSTLTPNGGSAISAKMSALEITWDLGSAHISGDNEAGGVACTAFGSPTVTGTINPLLAAGDIAAWWADIWSGDFFALATTGVFPLTRSADTGYSLVVTIPELTFNPETDNGEPIVRLSGSFTAREPTAGTSPTTLTIE